MIVAFVSVWTMPWPNWLIADIIGLIVFVRWIWRITHTQTKENDGSR